MKKEIELNGNMINYTLRPSTRAHSLRIELSVHEGLSVVLPRRWPVATVELTLKKYAGWILRKISKLNREQAGLVNLGRGRTDYLAAKEPARLLINARLAHFNEHYKLNIGRVSIKDQRSRWGSCSRAGNLNFNYRLANLPAELADYIIVHELCHLKELNHSIRFWCLVAETVPDYQVRQRELKKYQL